jgi:hypothetical protein
MPFLQKTLDRFWAKVNKDGPMHPVCGQCWVWTGASRPTGYGNFKINFRTCSTHRFSWIIHNGSIPKGLCVCHRCDNPSCVNPNHLWLGTRKDNSEDMVKKNRSNGGAPSGEKNPNAKLDEEQVLEIIKLYKYRSKVFGVSGLANKYKVSVNNVRRILSRKAWRHLTCLNLQKISRPQKRIF